MYKFIVFVVTYLICSINPAIEICKKKTGEDIRKLGSGNAGTANAMRVLGRPLGILVVILDISKVYFSFYMVNMISKLFESSSQYELKSMFIIATVIGQCFPIYYKFRGGKGVVVGITAGFILNQKVAIVCLVFSLIVIIITKIIAMGTLLGVILYVIMSLVMMNEYLFPVLVVCGIILFKHRASIQRILTKQEEKFW